MLKPHALHSTGDLKVTQMNVQHSPSQEHMFYKSELGHNAMETSKNIFCSKGQGLLDFSTITRCFQYFLSDCKELNDQAFFGFQGCAPSQRGKSNEQNLVKLSLS